MITNEQLLAALNAVPPLEWEAVSNSAIMTTLPTGQTIEIRREGHSTWLLFVTDPTESVVVNTILSQAQALTVPASTTTFGMTSTSTPSTDVVWHQLVDDATNEV